jgi:three-Cys-motif partner protein
MSKNNSDFFKEKKIWSTVKDELLGCYLVPYFSKIFYTKTPILYVDCFAGKGKFDDGKPGSPLTALESLESSLSKYSGNPQPSVSMRFIELNHYEDLEKNLPALHKHRCNVVAGKFEENILPILNEERQKNKNLNVFLYIDPYGVKVLNAELFDSLTSKFNTAELLINLNSFGFIREACRVKKVTFHESEDEIFSDLEEYDSSVLNSLQELNDIAGGDYWQDIIDSYNAKEIDCYTAEKKFSQKYKERLRNRYKYVLDMPIRLKPNQHPKYRMVHASNHPDGCLLMADNIASRAERLFIDIQSKGQTSFFEESVENEVVDEKTLTDNILTMLENDSEFVRLTPFLADFYNEYGVLCRPAKLSSGENGSALKTLERIGYIEVKRDPAITERGTPTKFWSENQKQKVWLRKKKG